MDAKILYVVGNGFDLHHSIPSSYRCFKCFVQSRDSDVYEWVESYIPAGEEWADLEVALAGIDTDNIVDDLAQFLPSYGADDWSDSGHHDFPYEVERVASGLSSTLQCLFTQWIRSLPIPNPESAPNRLKTLDPDGCFLTFNYTPTLSKVYGIPTHQVLHIHGCTDEDDNLVLGHAWAANERPSLSHSSDLETQDSRVTEALNELDDYFERTFKPSSRIISDNAEFFRGLDSVEEVVILGHGLSDVDRIYFEAIVSGLKGRTVPWTIAVRTSEGIEINRSRLSFFGVPTQQMRWKLWADM